MKRFDKIMLTPNIDEKEIQIRAFISNFPVSTSIRMHIQIAFNGEPVAKMSKDVTGPEVCQTIKLCDFNDHGLGRWWTPDSPHLYDYELSLEANGLVADRG